MEFPALATLLVLVQYFYFVIMVGKQRGSSGIKAPAMSGDEQFERALRVQMNTLEQMAIVIPALWLAAFYCHANVAAGFGLLFVIGRALYAKAYVSDPAKRGTGMILGTVASLALLVMALYGVVEGLLS